MKTTKGGKKPNPGSDEAINQGCTCAVLDNAHGRGARGTHDLPDDEKQFWISGDCPLHKDLMSDVPDEL